MLQETIDIKPEHRKALIDTGVIISERFGEKVVKLLATNKFMDFYECLTAVLYTVSSPSNLKFLTYKSRLNSFIEGSWATLGKTQSAAEMASCGFFYLKEDDHVKCFFCDLGLKDWDHGDDPMKEHVKFSPLCFYLKTVLGLQQLRGMSERPPNYPTSYTKQDHNQLVKLLLDEFHSDHVELVCKLGFNETKVLMCVCRKFIRFRQKYDKLDLIKEMHKEWDREMKVGGVSEAPLFYSDFDLADIGKYFYNLLMPNRQPAVPDEPTAMRLCKKCDSNPVQVVGLPCGHLSLCTGCARTTTRCPVTSCQQNISSTVRAFVE